MAAKISPVGRVSYPSLFEPNEYKGKRSFQVTLLFDKDADLAAMKAEATRVAREKWGNNTPKEFDSPFRNGDKKEDSPEYEGMTFVRFKRIEKKGAPQVVDARKRPIAEKSGDMYAGCYARVSYTCFAWEEGKNEGGVSFGLANVQKVRDGEPFDGRTNADDDFDALEEVDDKDVF